MEVIDDLDGHVARFTAALEARGGHVYFAPHRGGGERVRRGRLPEAGREARGEVEVDGDRGDRAERGARGGGRHAGGDRPRRVHPPARRRAPRAHRRAGDREDGRARSPSCSRRVGGKRVPPELEALTNAARTQLRETFLEADVGNHRRELRRLRDRLDLPGHERGQRPARQLAAARARRDHGDGAARADDRRPRRAPEAARAIGHRPEAHRLHDAPDRAAPRRARRTGRRSCTS